MVDRQGQQPNLVDTVGLEEGKYIWKNVVNLRDDVIGHSVQHTQITKTIIDSYIDKKDVQKGQGLFI